MQGKVLSSESYQSIYTVSSLFFFRLQIPIFIFERFYSAIDASCFSSLAWIFVCLGDCPNANAFWRVKFDSLSILSLNELPVRPITAMSLIK